MKPYLICLFGIVLLAVGCGGEKPAERAKLPLPAEATKPTISAENAPHRMDIGDVETGISIEGTVAAESRTPTVVVDEEQSRKGQLTTCTVTVNPPAPAEFSLSFKVQAIKSLQQSGQPILLRGNILRDEKPIKPFSMVFGGNAPAATFPTEVKVNALEGLPAPAPATTLLYMRVEVLLLAPGTDVSALDPATATGTPEGSSSLLSNPVRINFVAAGNPS